MRALLFIVLFQGCVSIEATFAIIFLGAVGIAYLFTRLFFNWLNKNSKN